jgi:membrane fusion protein (multidrug efflux system)
LKVKYWALAAVGICALGAAAWYWQRQGSGPAAASGSAAVTTAGETKAGKGPSGAPARGPAGPGGPGGPAPVEVAKVEVSDLSDDAQAVGSLRSRQGVVLRPEVSGRISRIEFQDGQRVRKGQLLVQFDDSLQQAQLLQAEAQASIARTNLQRSRELQAQGFVAQSAVDQNAAALQVAEAQVALAKAQVSRMRLVAPFDATAGIRNVAVGDYLKDGADIVGLEDLTAISVDFRLPERYLSRVKVGLPVEVAVDAWPERPFKAAVEAIDVQVDANGRALLVRARIDNAGASLKPGMFARPRLVFARRSGATLVPEEALVPQGSRQFVFRIERDAAGGPPVARRLEARIGVRLPGKVEILEGLAAGDQVVTAGHARLVRSDTAAVRIVDLAGAGAPRGAGNGPAAAASAAAASTSGSGVGKSGAPPA